MRIEGIVKAGIAVRDLEKTAALLADVFGVAPSEAVTYEPYSMRYCMFQIGDFFLELMEPTKTDGPIAKFIEEHGEGLQHMTLKVANIERAIADLKSKGVRFVRDTPIEETTPLGRVKFAFVSPRYSKGVLLQLAERL